MTKFQETNDRIKNIFAKNHVIYNLIDQSYYRTNVNRFNVYFGYVEMEYDIYDSCVCLVIHEIIENTKTPCEVDNGKITYELLHTRTIETKDENMFFETLNGICTKVKSSQMP